MSTSTLTKHAASAPKTPPPPGSPPPGPKGYPILGSIPDIQRDNIQTFMDAWRDHGDIVHFSGPIELNLAIHPDYVQRVLKDNYSNYPRPEFVREKLQSIVGGGLVAAEGGGWQHSRKLTQPAFHTDTIKGLADTFTSTTAPLLAGWDKHHAEGRAIDVKSEMMHISLANLAQALFQADLADEVNTVEPAVAFALAHTNRRLTSPIDPQRFPLPSVRKFEAGLDSINGIIYGLIRERRETAEGGDDLVSLLIQARDENGEGMSDEEIRDEVIGFFIAGHETVSSCLTWTWYLLSKNPDAWRRLKAEVDEVVGDRVPTVDDVPKLKYMERVLLEALRMYPPIFVLMRNARDDDEIGGYHIPAGANVVLCPYMTHRHPEFWDNPEGFDPDRFTEERAKGIHRMAFFPFAGGPRKCIGNDFAMLEMPLVIAMVLQRYQLSLAPGWPVVPEPAISLRPRDPLMMTLEPV